MFLNMNKLLKCVPFLLVAITPLTASTKVVDFGKCFTESEFGKKAQASFNQMKEQMELKAVEEILYAHPEIKNFQLKTSSLDGTSMKDMSDTGVVTYEIQIIGGERLVLFLFISSGWSNQYGLDFNRVKWKLFNRKEWLDLMKAYVETASRNEVSIDEN